MKYYVNVKEISYGVIEVEADNEDKAKEIAEEKYHMGDTVWKSGEHELDV